jgi:hypothetical protein
VTRAIVIGQSHSAAIAEALAAEGDLDLITVHRLGSKNRPFERGTLSAEDAIKLVQSLSSEDAVFLAMLGTFSNYLGMLRSGPDFDFLVDQADRADARAVDRIPHRAMAMAFDSNRGQAPTIEKIIGASKAPVFLLSSPPPKESNDYILHRLLRQSDQMKYGKSVQDFGIERPESRLKLWRIETLLSAKWARSLGISFVQAPVKCFNSNGFLARKYYYDDATHANASYGALVVQQIREIVQDMKKQAAAHG